MAVRSQGSCGSLILIMYSETSNRAHLERKIVSLLVATAFGPSGSDPTGYSWWIPCSVYPYSHVSVQKHNRVSISLLAYLTIGGESTLSLGGLRNSANELS